MSTSRAATPVESLIRKNVRNQKKPQRYHIQIRKQHQIPITVVLRFLICKDPKVFYDPDPEHVVMNPTLDLDFTLSKITIKLGI
jgi:hypothetical protein